MNIAEKRPGTRPLSENSVFINFYDVFVGVFPLARPSRVFCGDRRVACRRNGARHSDSSRLALAAKSSANIRARS